MEVHSHPLRTQAFPKKIQEEMDRLADEQMLKLKEFVSESLVRHRRGESVNTQARAPGLPAFLGLTRNARRHLHPPCALHVSSKRATPIKN